MRMTMHINIFASLAAIPPLAKSWQVSETRRATRHLGIEMDSESTSGVSVLCILSGHQMLSFVFPSENLVSAPPRMRRYAARKILW
eukprot:52539-Amphidinium_carterae.1